MAKSTDFTFKETKIKKNKELAVKIRVDEEELRQLKESAKDYKSVSDFIRFCFLKKNKKNLQKRLCCDISTC